MAGYVNQTYVKQGSGDNGVSCEQSPLANKVCPEICLSNTKPVCCLEGSKQFMPNIHKLLSSFIMHNLQLDTPIANGLVIRRIV